MGSSVNRHKLFREKEPFLHSEDECYRVKTNSHFKNCHFALTVVLINLWRGSIYWSWNSSRVMGQDWHHAAYYEDRMCIDFSACCSMSSFWLDYLPQDHIINFSFSALQNVGF